MLSYSKLSKVGSTFRSFTGLEVPEFDSLYERIKPDYEASERKRLLSRPDRKREIGGGGKFRLPLRERLLMLLVYYRLYASFTLVGFLFDLDQSNVFRDIRYLEPLVRRCVPVPKKLHELTRRLRTIEEVEEFFLGFKAIIDSTEQESLLGEEEEAHGEDPADGEREGPVRPQDEPCTRQEARLPHLQA